MSTKEQRLKRRKSAPHKLLSCAQSSTSLPRKDFGICATDTTKKNVEEDIESLSSQEEHDEEPVSKREKNVTNVKKWAFADLSNNFGAPEEDNSIKDSESSRRKSCILSVRSELERVSTSTKVPQVDRIHNKYKRHSTDSSTLKSKNDFGNIRIRQSSVFGDLSTIIDQSDMNLKAKVGKLRNQDQCAEKDLAPTKISPVGKRPRLDSLQSMKESKNIIFNRWIQSLAENSATAELRLDTADRYVEKVFTSSRETSMNSDRVSSGDKKQNDVALHVESLPTPTVAHSPQGNRPLIPTVDHMKYVYIDTIAPSCASTISVAETGPFTVSRETPQISTPSTTTTCIQNPSQFKSSSSPGISTVSSSTPEESQRQQCNMQTGLNRRSSMKKTKFPVCSTPFPNSSIKTISNDAPDFSVIESKSHMSNAIRTEPYQFGSMKQSDIDVEIEEDVDNGTQASVHISSPESQSSDGQDDSSAQGQKSNEWLQNANWHKSFTKSEVEGDHMDRKELKSLLQGGLAEYAWKLERKEKSERVIWSYKKLQKLKSSLHKALTVKINTLSVTDSILMSRCSLLKIPDASRVSSPAASGSDASRPSPSNNLKAGDQCFLLLKSYTAKDMELKSGNVLHIFPPWQTLNVPSLSSPVILCAYFVQVDDENLDAGLKKGEEIIEEVIFSSTHGVLASQQNHQGFSTASSNNPDEAARATGLEECHAKSKSHKGSTVTPGLISLKHKGKSFDSHAASDQRTNHHVQSLTFTRSIHRKESSVCARVQRIWCHMMPDSIVQHKLMANHNTATASSPSDVRYSLLLQDENLQYCELQLTDYKPEAHGTWKDVIENGEGKFFQFENLEALESLPRTRHPLLFSYLRELSKAEQDPSEVICYKTNGSCDVVSVSDFPEDSGPEFVPYKVEPLDRVFVEHKSQYRRITCAAKIICHAFDSFYLVDHSVKQREVTPYVRMKFCPLAFRSSSVRVGSIVAVVDAVIKKGVLYIDRHSRVSMVSPLVGSSYISSSQLSNRLGLSSEDAIALTFLDSSKCSFNSVSPESGVSDLVLVKGKVTDVDKETAVSWLECNFCSGENLYQDSQSRIFCASCRREVDLPRMFMKMSISVKISQYNSLVTSIELTSTTTKKMLEIPEEARQVQCNMTDVLGKVIERIFCYVKTKKLLNNVTNFELVEVNVR